MKSVSVFSETLSTRHVAWWGWGLVLAGVLPRVTHCFSVRALWFDEAALCINVLERDFGGLATPLAFKQIAPLFYLWWLKACTVLMGENVYAVRLPSLAGGVAALVLFWLVARRLLTPGGSLLATGLAACSQHLIYYAGEAKPYAIDVAAFLVVAVVALEMEEKPLTRLRLSCYSLVLSALVWLSYPAVFVIAGIGFVQLAAAVRRKDGPRLRCASIPYGVSAFSFLLLVWVVVIPSRSDTVTMEYMRHYWRHGFMPFPPDSFWAFRWYRERTFMFFEMPGGFTLQGLALFCWLCGIVSLGIRKPWHTIALLLPLALTLAASNLKVYPFHGRMTLFLAPIVFLFVGEGIAALLGRSRDRARCAIGAVLLALLCAQPVVRAARMVVSPSRHHELGVVLAEIDRHWKEGDQIYFRQGDYISYRFLAGRFDFPDAAIGVEARGEGAAEEEAAFLDSLGTEMEGRGRVWFPMAYDQESTVSPYVTVLESHGETFSRFTARGASAYGIDFSGTGENGAE